MADDSERTSRKVHPMKGGQSEVNGAHTPLPDDEYSDERKKWDWRSHYPEEARKGMRFEAITLIAALLVLVLLAGLSLGLADRRFNLSIFGSDVRISFRLLAIFCVGCLGGTTFSIKWLIHAAAHGRWHLDRRYWRLMTPLIGGVYACVVMTLFGSGLFTLGQNGLSPLPGTAALAFLVGYFSDGVSGLLSNIANAVFGTLEKK